MKNGVILFIFLIILSGCNDKLRSNISVVGINAVPETVENPVTEDSDPLPNQLDEPTQREERSTRSAPSRIVHFAQKVLENEGKKLGTACNHYVHRVLQAAGFENEIFLANDFDVYAKRHFKKFNKENFVRDAAGAEESRLKEYLWSFPERTAFIMQWSRTGVHGHVAIVERLGEKLVIFQASLGKRTPHKDQTTPSVLLNGYNRRELTIYSEMTPK